MADHAHDAHDRSVVQVEPGEPGAPVGNPAPPLRASDLLGLLRREPVWSDEGRRQPWPRSASPGFSSFIPSPLERPPSA